MSTSVLAAQLYTVRDFCKTPADIARTLARVKQIGYDAVQASALGPIEPSDFRKILDDNGLVCCATHVRRNVAAEFDAVVEEHQIIGCKYPAIGSMPGAYQQQGKAGYLAFAREQSELSRRFNQAGLTWGYHNHSFEFEKFDGKTGLDLLIENTDPTFTFEIDTFWVQHGGGDPAAWIRRLKGRIPLVHLKDMVVGMDQHAKLPAQIVGESDDDYQKRAQQAKARRPIMAEVGEGNLNWTSILAACREAGTVWYIVEQDICQRDPFESLAISLRNLRAMGLK
jgi:sugar phosphate isomerase/epimerase